MHRVVELELWAEPGVAPLDLSGKRIAAECRAELKLEPTVVLGLSFVPGSTDVENLGISLNEREVSLEQFESFCEAEGLARDTHNERSAASFLAKEYGQALAWLHFPLTSEGEAMCQAVSAWARKRRYVVVDPKELLCPTGEQGVSHYWHAVA